MSLPTWRLSKIMGNEKTDSTRSRQALHWVLLTISILALMLGMVLTAGFLGSTETRDVGMVDVFLALTVLIFLYFLPCLVIARSLKALKSYYQLTSVGIAGIMFFGATIFSGGVLIKTYNQFVQADENINLAFTNVELAYQKRFNLITNLDVAARRYQTHERQVVQDIVEARKSALSAATSVSKINEYDRFDHITRALAVNIENYPNLKADQSIQTLMKEIAATETELLGLKTTYNTRVTDYNKAMRLIPFGPLARLFGFRPKQIINRETSGADIYDAQKLLQNKPT